MTARRIKHARALARREEFFQNVKEGNLKVLNKVRDQRAEEERENAKKRKDAAVEKSERLAAANGATPKKRNVSKKES